MWNQHENGEQGGMDSSGEPGKGTIRRDLEYPHTLVIDPKRQDVAHRCHGKPAEMGQQMSRRQIAGEGGYGTPQDEQRNGTDDQHGGHGGHALFESPVTPDQVGDELETRAARLTATEASRPGANH